MTAPKSVSVKQVGKREFVIKRYYTGGKNIDEVLTRIAVSKAYEEIENEFTNNLEKNLPQVLAKRGLI